MKVSRLRSVAVAALALVAAGCADSTDPIVEPRPALGFVRFVHAVADTGALDYRFIDQVEYAPFQLGLNYRGIGRYQGATTGARRFRVFPTSNNLAVTSQILIDTTITVEAGRYYTVLHVGLARAGAATADRVVVIDDTPATLPIGTQISVRAVHAGTGIGNVDVYATAAAADPLPATPTFANIAFLGRSPYANVATGALTARLTAAGQRDVLITSAGPAGTPGTSAANPIGGTTIGGSVLTAFAFPAGAGANAGITSPSVIWALDRRPGDTF
ncbi:MAG: DUF4397 domain-containing protein [Gemmatimonadaceae bacterium]|nr:DUF4397 domain-containing protein [Gemmatimonadaceae bacterium]